MTPADIQGNFFKQIKQNLPAHLSLADEVAELLNISQDSAYRRIRGEKSLALMKYNYSLRITKYRWIIS